MHQLPVRLVDRHRHDPNGTVRTAVVIGVELITPLPGLEQPQRRRALRRRAAAVVLQASDREEGLMGEQLGCDAEARQSLRVRGIGCSLRRPRRQFRRHALGFRRPGDLQARRAVRHERRRRAADCKAGVSGDQIDLVVPHQANLRIIEAVAKYAGRSDVRVMVTVQRTAT